MIPEDNKNLPEHMPSTMWVYMSRMAGEDGLLDLFIVNSQESALHLVRQTLLDGIVAPAVSREQKEAFVATVIDEGRAGLVEPPHAFEWRDGHGLTIIVSRQEVWNATETGFRTLSLLRADLLLRATPAPDSNPDSNKE